MGKIKKHTEYYCDICRDKILYSSLPFSKGKIYKIKCYDHEGNRKKNLIILMFVINVCVI